MEEGFVADFGYGQVLKSSWSPGVPEPRRFVGGIKVNADEQIPMTAYRCASCGYVEFYAPPE